MKFLAHPAAMLPFFLTSALGSIEPHSLIFSGDYQNGSFQNPTFVNSVVGWDLFYQAGFLGRSTVIGNIEAGHVWSGHEAFVRMPGVTNAVSAYNNTAAGALNETDYHATMVGHVLAGSGNSPVPGGQSYTIAGVGMAPEAALVSGAIAVGFSSSDPGSFSTTSESVVSVYQAFFQGAGVARPDVINSSWGGGDPAASGVESLAIDSLARQNPDVALVLAAGNGGNAAVGAPASGFNNISVGSLGGSGFLSPSGFTSQGATDFHNPETGVTLTGVRSAVDIAAPGERMFLAAYLGDGGTIGAAYPELVENPLPTDLYFLNQDGTSFAAPVVAGGIALLKDVAKTDIFYNHVGNSDAFDTRVIKSVLMASAKETEGWDNGQDSMNVTTQALDARTGAGALDLVAAADVYLFGTRELAADGGGEIASLGWDSATIDLGSTFEYVFSDAFTREMTLTVALNWFSVREFDDIDDAGMDVAFSNLDLQVWSVDGSGQFLAPVGESHSTYNNTEFLRLNSLAAGRYGIRVIFDGMVFDTTDLVGSESFGLAWMAVPEPATLWLFVFAGGMLLRRRRV